MERFQKIDSIMIQILKISMDKLLQIFCKNIKIKYHTNGIHKTNIIKRQDKRYDDETEAIKLAIDGIIPDSKYIHDPKTKDKNGNTVAHLLAQNGHIPPYQWQHDPNIENDDGNTVCHYLIQKDLSVPKNWQDDQYKNPQRHEDFYYNWHVYHNLTDAMIDAIEGQVPYRYNRHDPEITDFEGHTVEYYLKQNNIYVPKYWKVE